jgi:hypothetical protein
MRPKNQKPPICIGGSKKTTRYGSPPLHERTFPRSLPRKRGRCREAIGMGFAHHYVYLSFYFYIILEIRQYPGTASMLGARIGATTSFRRKLFQNFRSFELPETARTVQVAPQGLIPAVRKTVSRRQPRSTSELDDSGHAERKGTCYSPSLQFGGANRSRSVDD